MDAATRVWHDERVDKERAMQELKEAVEDAIKSEPQRRARLRAALYSATNSGIPQKDLVALTGFNREHVRRLVEDERIERGEIAPTKRYLAAHKTER
jgi:hypothetical protein